MASFPLINNNTSHDELVSEKNNTAKQGKETCFFIIAVSACAAKLKSKCTDTFYSCMLYVWYGTDNAISIEGKISLQDEDSDQFRLK